MDQVRDELVNLWHQPRILLVIVLILGGWLVLQVLNPQVVQLEGLRAGDCIYVPKPNSADVGATRPIGSSIEVVDGLHRAGAERAPCDGSHGHEVAATFVFEEPPGEPHPGAGALSGRRLQACEDAFTGFVGRPLEGSSLELTLALPGADEWDAGRRAGACLVSRADGTFLSGRAAGSGL